MLLPADHILPETHPHIPSGVDTYGLILNQAVSVLFARLFNSKQTNIGKFHCQNEKKTLYYLEIFS